MTTSLTLPIVRADTLPEDASYPDTGCDSWPSCLTCPLIHCKYDVRLFGTKKSYQTAKRQLEIAGLRARGVSVATLARRYNISKRSIHRACQQSTIRAGHARIRRWNQKLELASRKVNHERSIETAD